MKSFITKTFLGLLFTVSASQCFGQMSPAVERAIIATAADTHIISEDVQRRNADRGFCGWLADHSVKVTTGSTFSLLCLGKYHRIIKRLVSYVRGNCLSDYAQIPDLCSAPAMISTVGLLALEPSAILGVLYLVYKFTKLSIRQKLLLASSLAVLGIAFTVAWL